MQKRLLAYVLIALMLLNALPVTYAIGFSDIGSHWGKAYIEKAAEAGIIAGYPDGTFKPDNQIRRVEFLVMVINAQDIAIKEHDDWRMRYVNAAIENGLIKADEFGSTDVSVYDQPITRQEMAGIIHKAYLSTGKTVPQDDLMAASKRLSDYDTVSPQYLDAAISTVALGYIAGMGDGTFSPKAFASRAQASVILYNHLLKIDKIDPLVSSTPAEVKGFQVLGIEVGDAASDVLKKLGEPIRKDISPYGFTWWVYHQEYSQYAMIGIEGNKVVGLYTPSPTLASEVGLTIGMTKAQTTALLGQPLNSITKGNFEFMQYNTDDVATYYQKGLYITAYFDVHDQGKLYAVNILSEPVEKRLLTLYAAESPDLIKAFEAQIFDLANVFRVLRNLKPLQYSEAASKTARVHSQDMAIRNFFDHVNPSGLSPLQRLLSDGIDHTSSAENIAAGYFDAFAAHNGWVNSKGHRDNLLRPFAQLGTGVAFGGAYSIYYTQNFFTP